MDKKSSALIDRVQFLKEHAMLEYMAPDEVVNKLKNYATIHPRLTEKVWRRLEEQNPEFFKVYYERLVLKEQILEFNKLLKKQKRLMDEEQTKVYHDVSAMPYSNEKHIPNFIENSACYYAFGQPLEGLNTNNVQHDVGLSNMFNNGGSSFGMTNMFTQGNISTMPYTQNSNGRSSCGIVDMSIHEDILVMPFGHNSNLDLTISVPECSNSSLHMFGSDGRVNEAVPNVGNASATLIASANSTFNLVNKPVLDRPYIYLNEPLSRSYSLSDIQFSESPEDDFLLSLT